MCHARVVEVVKPVVDLDGESSRRSITQEELRYPVTVRLGNLSSLFW